MLNRRSVLALLSVLMTPLAAGDAPAVAEFPLRLEDLRVRDPFVVADGAGGSYYL